MTTARSTSAGSATVGTAGHVDHGKSTLVEALTAINPDRLIEEQTRGLTIDLGFAWFSLPSGREVSVVDVPGHERFVHNMLAGIGGIDAVILVIAADEGVMPQTREHLDIIELLAINTGVVALTKVDAVDEEWLQLVEADIQQFLSDSLLADVPVVRVSAVKNTGLDDLRRALDLVLDGCAPRQENGRARLPIDRVFTMPGFGTVVTGTLSGGELATGDQLDVYPGGRSVRVRTLQSHRQTNEKVAPGRRVAVNLGGVSRVEIARGSVLAERGTVSETQRIDARLNMLAAAPRALRPGERIGLHVGTCELTASLRLLERDPISPGSEGWVQWRLSQPIAVMRGDRYVIRRLSPPMTIGGGIIYNAQARHLPRGNADVLEKLEYVAAATPSRLVQQFLGAEVLKLDELARRTQLSDIEFKRVIKSLERSNDLRVLGAFVVATTVVTARVKTLVEDVGRYHEQNPTGGGLAIGELARLLNLPDAVVMELVLVQANEGRLRLDGSLVSDAQHQFQLDAKDEVIAQRLLATLDAGAASPPSLSEALRKSGAGQHVVDVLIAERRLIILAHDLAMSETAFTSWVDTVRPLFDNGARVTVATVRDELATSRKFALSFLEHLDSQQITRRVGDVRVWLSLPDDAD